VPSCEGKTTCSQRKSFASFNRGLFYIKLTQRADGTTQLVALGIDPGSKFEGFTVKSEAHHLLNINARGSYLGQGCSGDPSQPSPLKAQQKRLRTANAVGIVELDSDFRPRTRARWGWKLRIAKMVEQVISNLMLHRRGI